MSKAIRLIKAIKFLGKHRNVGYGEIDQWEVAPRSFTENEILVIDGVLVHAIPYAYTGVGADNPTTVVGWTPPQWKVSLQTEGWPVGTPVEIDWFNAVEHL